MLAGAEHGGTARVDDGVGACGELDGVVQAKPQAVTGRCRGDANASGTAGV
jgi:hypothetical protein